jgi:hypothetical protein
MTDSGRRKAIEALAYAKCREAYCLPDLVHRSAETTGIHEFTQQCVSCSLNAAFAEKVWDEAVSRRPLPETTELSEIVEAYHEWAEGKSAPDFDAISDDLGRLCSAIQDAEKTLLASPDSSSEEPQT